MFYYWKKPRNSDFRAKNDNAILMEAIKMETAKAFCHKQLSDIHILCCDHKQKQVVLWCDQY